MILQPSLSALSYRVVIYWPMLCWRSFRTAVFFIAFEPVISAFSSTEQLVDKNWCVEFTLSFILCTASFLMLKSLKNSSVDWLFRASKIIWKISLVFDTRLTSSSSACYRPRTSFFFFFLVVFFLRLDFWVLMPWYETSVPPEFTDICWSVFLERGDRTDSEF